MDWNIIEGKWKELKGHAREQWGKLTDDELEEVGGKKDRLVGKLQQKYGYAADEADRRADEWAKQQDAATKTGQVPRRGVDPSRRSGAQAGARAISFRAVVATTG